MRATVVVFADDRPQLLSMCEALRLELQSEDGERRYLHLARRPTILQLPLASARVGFVADSPAEAIALLGRIVEFLSSKNPADSWEHRDGIYYRQSGIDPTGKRVTVVFSGQGSQYPEMGWELFRDYPFIHDAYDYMDSLLVEDGLLPISRIVFSGDGLEEEQRQACEEMLKKTQYTQAAIGLFSAGLYRLVERLGLRPDFMAGQSFGEIPALWAAGVVSDGDYFFMVKARGSAMASSDEDGSVEGAMMAVKGDIDKVTELVEEVPDAFVEAWNSTDQVVLSGLRKQLQKLQPLLQDMGYGAFFLPVSVPFHSPFMETAKKTFSHSIETVQFKNPRMPVYSNVTAAPYPDGSAAIRDILAQHVVRPVRFKEEIENIYRAGGYFFVELGPRNIATRLIQNILKDVPHVAIAVNPAYTRREDRVEHVLGCQVECDEHAPISCRTANISRGGVCLIGIPDTLGYGVKDVRVHLGTMASPARYSLDGRIMWRQGRLAGIRFRSPLGWETLGAMLGRSRGNEPEPVSVKDGDRQLREAIVQLIVAGLPLKTLDHLSSGAVSCPAFDLPQQGGNSEASA